MFSSNTTGLLFSIVFIIVVAFIVVKGLQGGKLLPTKFANKKEITGTCTLILYGGKNRNDLETVALFVLDNGETALIPQGAAYNYKTFSGLSGEEALKKAEFFISRRHDYKGSELRIIYNPRGEKVAFELRPLYNPITFGRPDILQTRYTWKDEKITFSIALEESVQRILDAP